MYNLNEFDYSKITTGPSDGGHKDSKGKLNTKKQKEDKMPE